ncbi:MAG: zinc ribbon domain-containing protein [Anaerolineales bacterium]|nr:zinc ribbon domain-containing protein [Anaerolineales bacterium]
MGRRRTVGYIENVWTCPNCGGENKGSLKACDACGAPQPENVQFHLPSEQKLVKDEAALKAAQAGADIHCGFCGTRNPATAETCSQCGGDLKEGKAREAGRIMQAPPPRPTVIKCQNCGTENPGTNVNCLQCGAALPKVQAAQAVQAVAAPAVAQKPMALASKPAAPKKTNWLLIAAIVGVLGICCVAIGALFLIPTSSVQATVTDVHWQTNVPVQEVQAVDYSNEKGNPPSGAYDVSCHNESRDVCEQKTIDKGNGYSEVVEECHTETDQYCSYTLDEWRTIQTYTLDGNNLQPVYDSPNLASDQRIGDKSEELTVNFSTDKGDKTYSPSTITEFQQYEVGSTWKLKLNLLGGIVSVNP